MHRLHVWTRDVPSRRTVGMARHGHHRLLLRKENVRFLSDYGNESKREAYLSRIRIREIHHRMIASGGCGKLLLLHSCWVVPIHCLLGM